MQGLRFRPWTLNLPEARKALLNQQHFALAWSLMLTLLNGLFRAGSPATFAANQVAKLGGIPHGRSREEFQAQPASWAAWSGKRVQDAFSNPLHELSPQDLPQRRSRDDARRTAAI